MQLGLMGRLQLDVKRLEYSLLSWFPNCMDLYVCLLASLALHVGGMTGVGCLLKDFTWWDDTGHLLNGVTCTSHIGHMTGVGWLLNGLTCTLHTAGMTGVCKWCHGSECLLSGFGGMTGTGSQTLLNCVTCALHAGGMIGARHLMNGITCTLHVVAMTGGFGCLLNGFTCTLNVGDMAGALLLLFHVGGMTGAGSLLNSPTCNPYIGDMAGSVYLLNGLMCILPVGGMAVASKQFHGMFSWISADQSLLFIMLIIWQNLEVCKLIGPRRDLDSLFMM
ncbi:hypothetical protein BKA82DRAFT_4012369 [Pisolithus tinctorius]|nr:hypothetical protein BKA82DRAFT_4012369 [Pisolithus tinctorius]